MSLYIKAISVWAVGGVFYLQKMIVEVGAEKASLNNGTRVGRGVGISPNHIRDTAIS